MSTQFIRTRGGFTNLSLVRTVTESPCGTRWHLQGDDGVGLGSVARADLDFEEATAPIVPASAGAHAVIIYADEEGEWIQTPAIVAWRITSTVALPVFIDEFPGDPLILFPEADGRLREPFSGSYLNLDEAKEMARERADKRATVCRAVASKAARP